MTENIWVSVRALEGKTIKTKNNFNVEILEVTDDKVQYDPARTKAKGSHSSKRGAIEYVARHHGAEKWTVKSVGEALKGTEYESGEQKCHSYIYAILHAVGVIE